jgi:V8-like Glu-specific endopeptidase
MRATALLVGGCVTLMMSTWLVKASQLQPNPGPQPDPGRQNLASPSVTVDPPVIAPGRPITNDTLRSAIENALRKFDLNLSAQAELFGMTAEDRMALISSQVPIGFSTLQPTRMVPDPGPEVSASDPRVRPLRSQPRIEAQIGENNFLPVRFLEGGVIAARAVGRIATQFDPLPDAGLGSGFMVSPTLFITNNHVIPNAPLTASLELQFNYQYSLEGSTILQPVSFEFDAASFFDTNPELDFTLIRVKPRAVTPAQPAGTMSTIAAGTEFGFLQLTDRYLYTKGQLANVVQHPAGRPKEIALHNNVIEGIYANVIRYTTDTDHGSSGAPVFNNSWKVIALHHAAGERDQQRSVWKNNEGIRTDVILKHMRRKYPQEVLKELGL